MSVTSLVKQSVVLPECVHISTMYRQNRGSDSLTSPNLGDLTDAYRRSKKYECKGLGNLFGLEELSRNLLQLMFALFTNVVDVHMQEFSSVYNKKCELRIFPIKSILSRLFVILDGAKRMLVEDSVHDFSPWKMVFVRFQPQLTFDEHFKQSGFGVPPAYVGVTYQYISFVVSLEYT